MSTGPATDSLVAKAQRAVTGISVGGQQIQVVDGEPGEVFLGSFVIGLSEPPPNQGTGTVSSRDFIGLPMNHVQEDYEIPCYIDVRVPGTVQKTPRDLAQQAFNAFWPLIKADPQLGGALSVGEAKVTTVTEMPSNVGTAAEPGRRHLIQFGVHCWNRTT